MLNDKVVLITGAGSGLGRALALEFCKQGAKVIGLGRNQISLQETHKKIAAPERFEYYPCDVSQFEALAKIVAELEKKHQGIDYVFNNAAIYPKVNIFEQSAEEFKQVFDANVIGVANVCKLVIPGMLAAKKGRVFNVGSFADFSPIANSAAYSASKGALHALTKAIATDIAHHQSAVQVFEWIPGHLNTQMSDYTGMAPEQAAKWGVELAERNIEKNNAIFLGADEWLPPRSFKEKVLARLRFWQR